MYLGNVALCNDQSVEFSIDHAWDPDFFFGMGDKPLCLRAVRRCTVVLSNVYREGGGTEVCSFICNGGICLGLGLGLGVGPERSWLMKTNSD